MNSEVYQKTRKVYKDLIEMEVSPDFLSRLERKNGWTSSFTKLCFREYKRFILLGWMGDGKFGPVVPSKPVDEVWHEHILHTKHYYEKLCGDILGRPFHHHPDDKGDFKDGYLKTLDLYEKIFQESPPEEIWIKPCRGLIFKLKNKLKVSFKTERNPSSVTTETSPVIIPNATTIYDCASNQSEHYHNDCSIHDSTSSHISCDYSSCGSGCGGGGD